MHEGPQPGVFLFAETGTVAGIGIVTCTTNAQGVAHRHHGVALFFQVRDDGIDLFQFP
jgi:hypothetical protein